MANKHIHRQKTSPAAKVIEQVRFIGALAKSPKTVGAVAPTSRKTAELMASNITRPTKLPVLELGPGTGAITNAILHHGVAEKNLFAVEYDPRFCRQLRARLPQAHVIEGNAFELDEALGEHCDQKFDCVISGLPLLNFDRAMRQQFLKGALKRLPLGRPLVQFSYGTRPPIEINDPDILVEKSRWVLRNLPPSRVWTYRYSAPN